MYQSIFNTNVSFLPRVNCNDREIQTISLGRALLSESWRREVEALRAEKDRARQKALKDALPCFTPSGIFSHVSRTGLIEHSGYISIDIDCKPDEGINPELVGFDLKAAISTVPHIAYCGRSCRGSGYVVIIPIADPAKHSEYFRALAYHFERAGLEIDRGCRDICRKRFVSWDPDPFINTAARPWAITLPERDTCSTREILGRDLGKDETAAQVEAIIDACEEKKWDITADRQDWVRILSALANTFGEAGRDFAHRISANYPGYTPEETDRKFTDMLKHPEYAYTIATFFHIAKQEIGKHDFDHLIL